MTRWFAKYKIPDYEVFFENEMIYAMVNTKPVVPGHVLIVPQRTVQRFYDLTNDEMTEMMSSAKKIGKVVEDLFKATALTFVIQDGKDAGQSVEHVHLHILPRRPGDFEKNDDVYDILEGKPNSTKIDLDNMPPRTEKELSDESELIRNALTKWKD